MVIQCDIDGGRSLVIWLYSFSFWCDKDVSSKRKKKLDQSSGDLVVDIHTLDEEKTWPYVHTHRQHIYFGNAATPLISIRRLGCGNSFTATQVRVGPVVKLK